MTVADRIRRKLSEGLRPFRLEVIDESHRHEGHAGAAPGGETHFRVEVVSAAFEGRSRVDRQRLIYDLLAADIGAPIHALSIQATTPAEVAGEGVVDAP